MTIWLKYSFARIVMTFVLAVSVILSSSGFLAMAGQHTYISASSVQKMMMENDVGGGTDYLSPAARIDSGVQKFVLAHCKSLGHADDSKGHCRDYCKMACAAFAALIPHQGHDFIYVADSSATGSIFIQLLKQSLHSSLRRPPRA